MYFRENSKSVIIYFPYGIYRQVNSMNNIYLSKWIPYTNGDHFSLYRNHILTIASPSTDLLQHYSECLQEEINNEIDTDERINATQYSYLSH